MTKTTLKVAMTVDDLFMWPGLSFPDGWSAVRVSDALMAAFAEHHVDGVYSFSCTRPVVDSGVLPDVLDAWCAAGHHVGNHTHSHCALNWCSAERYERDIEVSERVLEPWIARAPSRYFRFAFDMWGDRRDKTDRLLFKLARSGYRQAPISMWFSDTMFMFPHMRAIAHGDREVASRIESQFVESWMAQLESQAEGARAAMGREVTHIALVHGVPLAATTMARILGRMRDAGVSFVSLDEAMRDPFNAVAPPSIERRFRNVTQKWCALAGVKLDDMPPAELGALDAILPVPGMDVASAFTRCFAELARDVDGVPVIADFLE
jgi:peptidoglycan/xylan/chitin deacetylase (PgdA/CDA1 family)